MVIPEDMLGKLKDKMTDLQKREMIRKLQVQSNIVHYQFSTKDGENIEVCTRSINPELALSELHRWWQEVKK